MSLDPFDLAGGPFLALYLALAVVALIVSSVVPARLRPEGRAQAVSDPDAIAYLAGGNGRFGEAVIARMLAGGTMTMAGTIALAPGRRDAARPGVEQGIAQLSAPVRWRTVTQRVQEHGTVLRKKLEVAGLIMDADELGRMGWWQALPFIVLGGFGMIKLAVGLSRDRPVGFLIVLLILTAIAAMVCRYAVDGRTQAGHDAVAEARRRHARLKIAPTSDEATLAVALFGTSVLAGSAFGDFHRMRSAGDSGWSDGGSSDGGGSGCGGGCGGCSS